MATIQDLNNPQAVDMIQATPSSALQNEFMQTPGYQLAYGNSPSAFSMDPSQRFFGDAGTQMAIRAGMQPLMNNYAAHGLGQSGALAQGLGQYMYNNYNQFTGNQSSLFNNYQNQLQNLTQFGAQNSGSANAMTTGTNLAALVQQAATQMGNANLSTGSNISQLLANLGISNAGSILNTGAAQSNNIGNGFQQLLQLQNNQAASNASSASSYLGGQGAMAGSQGLFNGYGYNSTF